MKEIIMQAKDLCKSFANNGMQNHILDNINLDIYKGDFTVIMGASGSGKSTLLYSLSGMDAITSGDVLYKGKSIWGNGGTKRGRFAKKDKENARLRSQEFGFVFQQIHLVSNLTLYENIVSVGYLLKEKTSTEVRERANQLLEKVHVSDAKDRLPSQVSGGEAQRAAIVRAIINEPGLLFADEPTGALNRRNTEEVLKLLTQLNKEGQSILMVTHDVHAAIRATRLLYLEDGKICGEMELGKYVQEDAKRRETQVNAWLSSMSW